MKTRKAKTSTRRAASATRAKLGPVGKRVHRRLPRSWQRVVDECRGQDVLLYAAGLAFYALVSLVPLAIFVVWVTSLIMGDDRVHTMAEALRRVAPKSLDVGGFVERVASLGTSLGVPALLTGLWPATSYGGGLRRAFDRISSKNPKEMKGLRGRGLVLVVILPVFILGSLVASYAGTSLLQDGIALSILGYIVALAFGFVGAAIGIALIYRIYPPERLPWRSVLKGTLFAAGAISILSLFMTLFLNVGANFEEHFATSGMAALVLVGLWLFLSNALLLVGYKVAQLD